VLWPKKGAFDNVNDLKEQAFYRFIAKTYWGHIALQFALLYAIGGWPWFVWLGCIRVCHHQQTMFPVKTCLSVLFETTGFVDFLMCKAGSHNKLPVLSMRANWQSLHDMLHIFPSSCQLDVSWVFLMFSLLPKPIAGVYCLSLGCRVTLSTVSTCMLKI